MPQPSKRSAIAALFVSLSCGASDKQPAATATKVGPPPAERTELKSPESAATSADKGAKGSGGKTPGSRLLVAGETGLVQFDIDGNKLAQLSTAAASHPRSLDDGSVLFLEPVGASLFLKRYSSAEGVKELAKMPTSFDGEGCKLSTSAGDEEPLSVQSNSAFSIDRANGFACITIADRNENMAEVSFDLRVNLKSGEVESSLSLDNIYDCAEGKRRPCSGKLVRPDEPDPSKADTVAKWAWDWDPNNLLLFPEGKPKHESARHLCAANVDPKDVDARDGSCASHESRSGSGRFVLVSGPSSQGDYIHRELFVLDLKSGDVLAMMRDEAESEFTFKTVGPAQVVTEFYGSVDVVGESDVRWLEGDRLWIDGLLVNPAARTATQVGGDLAW